jgi:hypothetical protein
VSGGFASDPLSDIDVSFGPDALSDVDVSLTCGGDPDTDTERGNDGKSGSVLSSRLSFVIQDDQWLRCNYRRQFLLWPTGTNIRRRTPSCSTY